MPPPSLSESVIVKVVDQVVEGVHNSKREDGEGVEKRIQTNNGAEENNLMN